MLQCKFDNIIGRTLAFQEPPNTISTEEFDAVSEYLIPKPQLCGQLIVLRGARTLLCWPVCLEDPRYERNALIFALGFVHDGAPESDVSERYGPVLRKACGYLAALESESSLLSDATREGELAHLLPQVLIGLRERGTCAVAADAANTIHLWLPPPRRGETARPATIDAHMVPVFVAPYERKVVRQWDLSLQKVLPWVDGTRTTAQVRVVAVWRRQKRHAGQSRGPAIHTRWRSARRLPYRSPRLSLA